MANWAFVENEQIKELHDFLPKSWKNVSGLRKLEFDVEKLNSLGWYSVVKDYQEYDSSFFVVKDYNYTFDKNKVIESLNLVEKSVEDELSFEEQKLIFLQELRQQRDNILAATDWTQLPDTQILFNEETKQAWLQYRQTLRNLPQQHENDEIISLSDIIWPKI